MNKQRLMALVICVVAAGLVGCQGAQKTMPHLGMGGVGMGMELDRGDIVVLESVEGTSTTTSFLLGVVQIIDGTKVRVAGIRFFKDKYTYDKGGPSSIFATILGLLPIDIVTSTADRAYYKALEKSPDADAVFSKSMDNEEVGIPLLFVNKTVTYRGKAVKIKTDK